MLANLEAKADLKLKHRQLASKYNQGSSRNQRAFLTRKETYFEMWIKIFTLHCLYIFAPPAT